MELSVILANSHEECLGSAGQFEKSSSFDLKSQDKETKQNKKLQEGSQRSPQELSQQKISTKNSYTVLYIAQVYLQEMIGKSTPILHKM